MVFKSDAVFAAVGLCFAFVTQVGVHGEDDGADFVRDGVFDLIGEV